MQQTLKYSNKQQSVSQEMFYFLKAFKQNVLKTCRLKTNYKSLPSTHHFLALIQCDVNEIFFSPGLKLHFPVLLNNI